MADGGDIDLTVWDQTSDSPLHSDNSDGALKDFGDLTIEDVENDANGFAEDRSRFDIADEGQESERMDRILQRLTEQFNDFLSPAKSQLRFTELTELDETEKYAEPDLIRATSSCSLWPCDMMADAWLKAQLICVKKCKLPCCESYARPHEWARRRRFHIPKRTYLPLTSPTSCEAEAVTIWSDLIRSREWQDGNWNERGVLLMSDGFKFRTRKVCWTIMEEHLAALAYSGKKPLVLLAARLCMESLAKNKALYTYSHQYWGFARICVDMLKSSFEEVQEGLVVALQLYLRTLKIFHSCFSHKCLEYASAGIFPVLLSLLDTSGPSVQAMIVNILVLMAMNASYINLIAGLEGLGFLIRLARSEHQLLERRAHACLEVVSRHVPTQAALIHDGVLVLAVMKLADNAPVHIQLNCLFTLNSLCTNSSALLKTLAVDSYSVVRTAMRILTDWAARISSSSAASRKVRALTREHSQTWCTVPRQNLILLCKLSVDDAACEQIVREGAVLSLKAVWDHCDTETDEALVMETLASMSRLARPAAQLCQQGFLPVFTKAIHILKHQENILTVISNLGPKYLAEMLTSGLVREMLDCLGSKVLQRQLYPGVLVVLASFGANDKLRDLILGNDGQVYTFLLDTAFLTSDQCVLRSCVTILARLNTTAVPLPLLKQNCLQLVAYIDKLLQTGPDGLVLHGLMQLQDYTQVDLLHKSFREHKIQLVLEALCVPPYKAPVQILAVQMLEMFTGVRSRRSSVRDDRPGPDDPWAGKT